MTTNDETSETNETTTEREALTIDEAAALVGMSPDGIRDLLVNGHMRGRCIGGAIGWRTTRRAVLAWIEGEDAGLGRRETPWSGRAKATAAKLAGKQPAHLKR